MLAWQSRLATFSFLHEQRQKQFSPASLLFQSFSALIPETSEMVGLFYGILERYIIAQVMLPKLWSILKTEIIQVKEILCEMVDYTKIWGGGGEKQCCIFCKNYLSRGNRNLLLFLILFP